MIVVRVTKEKGSESVPEIQNADGENGTPRVVLREMVEVHPTWKG